MRATFRVFPMHSSDVDIHITLHGQHRPALKLQLSLEDILGGFVADRTAPCCLEVVPTGTAYQEPPLGLGMLRDGETDGLAVITTLLTRKKRNKPRLCSQCGLKFYDRRKIAACPRCRAIQEEATHRKKRPTGPILLPVEPGNRLGGEAETCLPIR